LSNDEEPRAQDGDVNGSDVGDVNGSDVGDGDGDGIGNVGVSYAPDNFEPCPLMSRCTLPLSNATHFYWYMDDHFSRLNMRFDAIDEWQ